MAFTAYAWRFPNAAFTFPVVADVFYTLTNILKQTELMFKLGAYFNYAWQLDFFWQMQRLWLYS